MPRLSFATLASIFALGGIAVIPHGATAAPPVRITPRVTLVYDSNVARGSDELARLRGVSQSDFRVSPGLNVSTELPVGSQTVFLAGDASYDFYARNNVLNRLRLTLDGGARVKLSRCGATVSGSLAHRQSNLEDRLDLGQAKNTEFYRRIGFEARCGAAIGVAPIFGLSQSWSDNSAELLRNADVRATDGKIGLAYARPSLGDLSVMLEQSRVRYPDRPEGFGLSDGYNSTSVGVRFSRSIGARLRGSLGLSRTSVDPLGGGTDSFSGLTSNLDLTYRAPSELTLQVLGRRDVRPAALGNGDFVVASSYGARATYPLSVRLSVAGGVDFERRSIRGETNPLFIGLDRERRRSLFGRATYRRNDRASVDLELRREARNAEPDLFDYKSTRAIMNLRLGF